MKKKNYFLVGIIMFLFVSAVVFDVKNTQAANPKESPVQLTLSPDSSSLVSVKKGDKLKYNITLTDSGIYSGKVSVTLMDVPPGVKATLKMDSDSISSGGSIKGTLDLDIVGRVPSGKNRVVLSFAPSDYTFCDAYDITCVWRADFMKSKIFYLNGTDSSYGNSSMPSVINSVEPSILKRVKLFVSDFRRENPGFSLMDVVYGNNPFLAADEMIGIYCQGQENCQAGDVDYEQWYTTKIDLSDPLNPKKAERGAMINQADRTFGHGVRPTSLGMSRNTNLSFITWLRGDLFMASKSPSIAKTLISDSVGGTELSPTGDFIIADSSSDTFLIRNIYSNDPGNRFEKVSDFKNNGDIFVPASIPTNVPQILDYGTPTAVIRALDGESSDYIAVLGNGGKNTPQIANSKGKDYKLSDLSFYSLEKKSALGITNLSGLESLDASSTIIYGFETPTGKYAFVAAREKAPSSPMSEYNRVMYGSKRTFYLYGLDEAGKKLIPIMAKGLMSEAGEIKSVAPIHVSGKDFLAVFVNAPDSSAISKYSVKVLIYSFDDLKAGNVRNIASSSISSMKQILRATSLIKNGETYMYTIDDQGAFLIWKFDKNSFSSSGANVVVQPPTGGVPFYPTYPSATEDANCPGGTIYKTSAGSLCVNSSGGVTTTTSYNYNPPIVPSGSAKPPTPPINNLGDFILKKGSSGEKVKELQKLLNNDLNISLVVDGKMGPNTVAAVKQWQSRKGLVSDGIVGPKTREVMNMVTQ